MAEGSKHSLTDSIRSTGEWLVSEQSTAAVQRKVLAIEQIIARYFHTISLHPDVES
jgi:hypothetical protein